MTVSEFIKYLRKQPAHAQVAYRMYSEQCLLDTSDIVLENLCPPRPDGWVQNARPDKPTELYLLLPGN